MTIGRHPGVDAAVCDLTDADAMHKAVRAVGDCDAVVHLAARAHDFRGLSLDDLLLANTATTRNLIAALRAEGRTAAVRFVHASSVAVYELLDTEWGLTAAQAPYAASKLQAEQLLHAEPFRSLCVLRFAPIYDSGHLQDVAKRVFLPGTRLKLRLCPPPVHRLCSLDRAVQAVVDAVEWAQTTGFSISNVTDQSPIRQDEMASWFPGPALPVPAGALRALSSGLRLCGKPGRTVARFIHKFASEFTYPDVGERRPTERLP
jgi:nucleoside-diphosphate-sugar epimerase